MARRSEPKRAEEESGRDFRLKLALLATALVLVAGYATAITDVSGMVRRQFAALSMSDLPVYPMIGIVVAALLAGVAVLLSRRHKSANGRNGSAGEAGNALDQLAGRNGFLGSVNEQVEVHAKSGRQFAVHLFDIDRFRLVNEVLGEVEGDAFLRMVAERLLVLVGNAGRLARLGDDEFAVIQPEAGGARHAEIFAGRIQDTLKDLCAQLPRRVRPGASIGIAVFPDHGADAARLLHNAALALNRAKGAGGGGCRVYTRDMEMALDADLQMEKAISDGLQQGRFELHFQPQYDLTTRRLVGFEALVRMNHPERGQLLPASFLPTAEASALIQPLGDWAIRDALSFASTWPSHLTLSINISPAQFRLGDVAATVASALAKADYPGERLQLEISEATMLSAPEAIDNQFRELKKRGVAIVIDDFGLGSSRLQALARMRCDAVKLDRTLTKSLGQDAEAEQFIRSLTGTARSFGLEVRAGGIESVEQVQFLMSNGCEKVQGYLFGRPAPAPDIAAIIAKDMRKSPEAEPGRSDSVAA